jgi:hypothetical protein
MNQFADSRPQVWTQPQAGGSNLPYASLDSTAPSSLPPWRVWNPILVAMGHPQTVFILVYSSIALAFFTLLSHYDDYKWYAYFSYGFMGSFLLGIIFYLVTIGEKAKKMGPLSGSIWCSYLLFLCLVAGEVQLTISNEDDSQFHNCTVCGPRIPTPLLVYLTSAQLFAPIIMSILVQLCR